VIGLAALGMVGLGLVLTGTWLLLRAENRSREAEAREQKLAQRQQGMDNLRQFQLAARPHGDGAGAKKDLDLMFQQILPFVEQPQGAFWAAGGKPGNDPSLPPEAKRLGELLNVQFRSVDPTLGRHLGLAPGQGLVVASVRDNWRAQAPSDLHSHDVLLQLGGAPVKAAEAAGLVQVVSKAEARIDAAVVRDGRRVELKGVPVLRKAEEGPAGPKP
jgi:hypothetical protein